MTTFLNKKMASIYFTKICGLPVSVKLLSKLITTGGGPKYYKFRSRVVYELKDLDEWAASHLSDQYRNSGQEVK